MAILTKMSGIPLFSTAKEAVKWAKARRLNGYHVHYWEGQKGYMGGANHAQAAKRPVSTTRRATTPRATPIRQTTTTRQTTTPQRTPGPGTPTSGGGY